MPTAETDPDEAADLDPWLTVAEIAEELRVNPATVRLWISKEILPATRAGRRKLLIRRSDLDEMLRATQDARASAAPPVPSRPTQPHRAAPPESVRRLEHVGRADPRAPHEDVMDALEGLQLSDEAWRQAQAASENAPPDPDFPQRLHALARAAESQSESLARAGATARMSWKPIQDGRDVTISHELRRGGNRPGPPSLWAEFDRCVQRLGLAMEGRDMMVIATRYHDLAAVFQSLTGALSDNASAVRRQRG
jgi:excisionase family DNA binding protein